MKLCPVCLVELPPEAFPRNRTGACKQCHAELARRAYSQRATVAAAVSIIAVEDALAQLWCLSCPMCGYEVLARRRATERPLQIAAGAVRCQRCDAGCWGALVSGPATLGAAQAEIERLAIVSSEMAALPVRSRGRGARGWPNPKPPVPGVRPPALGADLLV